MCNESWEVMMLMLADGEFSNLIGKGTASDDGLETYLCL